ncbi:hypothetical protein JOC78_000744 [Bacillus ectoiniformans]|nr:hypothetical protein [Bacillus ectoiniformans]
MDAYRAERPGNILKKDPLIREAGLSLCILFSFL